MFGWRFIKAQPTQYVIAFRNGQPRREGIGLSLAYFAPTTSLVVVPTDSVNEPFIFQETTADFQELTVQGQITYRIAEPRRTAAMLNFALDARGGYVSDDPAKLSRRLLDQVQVAMMAEVQALPLKDALACGDRLVERVGAALRRVSALDTLGIEVLGLSVLAIKPKPETARALEAEAREALLRRADEAIYARRNAAVEQERSIRENELNTEIAVENKQRQIKEAQMDAERVVAERRRRIEQEEMEGKIVLEQRNRELIGLTTDNLRQEADARAYGIDATMKAFAGCDARVLQSLASVGMQPGQMLALAFRELAENAGKIGALNITPDLLSQLMEAK